MYQHLINFFQPPLEEVIIFPKNAIKLENTIKLMVILSDTNFWLMHIFKDWKQFRYTL